LAESRIGGTLDWHMRTEGKFPHLFDDYDFLSDKSSQPSPLDVAPKDVHTRESGESVFPVTPAHVLAKAGTYLVDCLLKMATAKNSFGREAVRSITDISHRKIAGNNKGNPPSYKALSGFETELREGVLSNE
jgi:hypothetical protein